MSKKSTKKQLAAAEEQMKQLTAAEEQMKKQTLKHKNPNNNLTTIDYLKELVCDYSGVSFELNKKVESIEKILNELKSLQKHSNELWCKFADFEKFGVPKEFGALHKENDNR